MKTRVFISLIFLSLLSSLMIIPDGVVGQSYYNWLDNPSFNPALNLIEDYSFESGAFSTGTTYGNWSASVNSPTISTDAERTGVYGLKLYYGGTNTVASKYEFAEDYNETLGADVIELSFWTKQYGSGDAIWIRIYYSDASYDDSDIYTTVTSTWEKIDVTEFIDGAKFIWKIEIRSNGTNPSFYVDDVTFSIEGADSQTELSTVSSPWYLAGVVGSNYVGIVDDFGNTDNYSCRFSSYSYDNYKIIQDMDYFDAELIQYIECYAYSEVNASEAVLGIQCQIAYTDGSVDEKEKFLTVETPSWELLNFGQAWIDDTKYIQSIRFKLADDSMSQTIWIDDCAVYVEEGQGASRFTWTTSPEPQEKTTAFARLYQGTTYSIFCTVYNATGTAEQNGTATYTTREGSSTTDILLGEFNFTLSPRNAIGDIFEYIGITMELGEGIPADEVLVVTIQIQWEKAGSGTGGGDGGVGEDGLISSQFMTSFVIIGMVVLMPSLVLAGIGSTINASMGIISFIGGLTLMSSISLAINVVNEWFMFAVIIIDVLVILGLLRSNRD